MIKLTVENGRASMEIEGGLQDLAADICAVITGVYSAIIERGADEIEAEMFKALIKMAVADERLWKQVEQLTKGREK